eukprot:CAMPEP_0204088114 /NCGR_PEP_ID=MMETSP0360-20130528/185722_1 /ASSEMBLY_ACC=CAM_ASM_000342 /TAXON_ID=268821 /ORGANISM="Scrippsiella Hangoei, Strain SHTV-5" /LENGTH=43 /DNA_ID= /DNA_START= /DNA_END= /DNA_ORIENTATION=
MSASVQSFKSASRPEAGAFGVVGADGLLRLLAPFPSSSSSSSS